MASKVIFMLRKAQRFLFGPQYKHFTSAHTTVNLKNNCSKVISRSLANNNDTNHPEQGMYLKHSLKELFKFILPSQTFNRNFNTLKSSKFGYFPYGTVGMRGHNSFVLLLKLKEKEVEKASLKLKFGFKKQNKLAEKIVLSVSKFQHFYSIRNSFLAKSFTTKISNNFYQNKSKILFKTDSLNLFKIREAILPCAISKLTPNSTNFFLFCKLNLTQLHHLSLNFKNDLFNGGKFSTILVLNSNSDIKLAISNLLSTFTIGPLNEILLLLKTFIGFGAWRIEILNNQFNILFPKQFDPFSINLFTKYIGANQYLSNLGMGHRSYDSLLKEDQEDPIYINNYRTELVDFVAALDDNVSNFKQNQLTY